MFIIEVNNRFVPEGSGQHGTKPARFCLMLADQAQLHLHRSVGMIIGQTANFFLPHQIDAGVSDMPDEQFRSRKMQTDRVVAMRPPLGSDIPAS